MVPLLLHVEEQSSTPAASVSLHRRQDNDKIKANFVDVKFVGQERVRQQVHFNSATFQQPSLSIHRSHHHGFFQLSLQQSRQYLHHL